MAKKKFADIEDYIPTPSTKMLKSVEGPVNAAAKLSRDIASMEAAITAMKADLTVYLTKTIPDAMAEAGTSDFTSISTGARVYLKKVINGSIPKDAKKREAAFEWLVKNDAEALIKFGINVVVDKGDIETAKRVTAGLDKAKIPYDSKLDVHPQTLAAYARERMEKGAAVPLELLGLYAATIAKIELPASKGDGNGPQAKAAHLPAAKPVSKPTGKGKGSASSGTAPIASPRNGPGKKATLSLRA